MESYKLNSLISLQIPLFSVNVKGGFPSPADDYIDSKLDFNQYLIRHPEATYCVKVSGDSMINSGIFEGDMLIVDRSLELYDNCIGVFALNNEFTVKHFTKRKDKIFLIPANPKYREIEISDNTNFEVFGVVSFVIHKT